MGAAGFARRSAVLTKGPLAVVLAGLVVLARCALRRSWAPLVGHAPLSKHLLLSSPRPSLVLLRGPRRRARLRLRPRREPELEPLLPGLRPHPAVVVLLREHLGRLLPVDRARARPRPSSSRRAGSSASVRSSGSPPRSPPSASFSCRPRRRSRASTSSSRTRSPRSSSRRSSPRPTVRARGATAARSYVRGYIGLAAGILLAAALALAPVVRRRAPEFSGLVAPRRRPDRPRRGGHVLRPLPPPGGRARGSSLSRRRSRRARPPRARSCCRRSTSSRRAGRSTSASARAWRGQPLAYFGGTYRCYPILVLRRRDGALQDRSRPRGLARAHAGRLRPRRRERGAVLEGRAAAAPRRPRPSARGRRRRAAPRVPMTTLADSLTFPPEGARHPGRHEVVEAEFARGAERIPAVVKKVRVAGGRDRAARSWEVAQALVASGHRHARAARGRPRRCRGLVRRAPAGRSRADPALVPPAGRRARSLLPRCRTGSRRSWRRSAVSPGGCTTRASSSGTSRTETSS